MAKKKTTTGSQSGSAGAKKKSRRKSSSKKSSISAQTSKATEDDQDSEVEELARLHLWQVQAVRDLLFVGAVVGLIWFGYVLRDVTVPLLVALMLAYLFEPLVQWLSRQTRIEMNRIQAVMSILVVIGGSVIVVLAIVLPILIGQAAGFVGDITNGTLHGRLSNLTQYVPTDFQQDVQNAIDILPASKNVPDDSVQPNDAASESEESGEQENTPDAAATNDDDESADTASGDEPVVLDEARIRELIAEAVTVDEGKGTTDGSERFLGIAGRGATAVVAIMSTIIRIGLLLFLIPFYFFFFSLWYPHVIQFFRKFIPDKNRERTLDLLDKMDRVVAGFVRGRIIISLIMSAMLAVGWMFCGVPYALPLGIMIGVFSLVPYLGGIGIPIAAGLLFIDQLTVAPDYTVWLGLIGALLWPTLVYAIVQVIESYYLTPVIQGKATNLDPVTIVVAVLAGGSVLGVYGMLLAIPVAACVRILASEVLLPQISAWTRGEASDPLPIGRGDRE